MSFLVKPRTKTEVLFKTVDPNSQVVCADYSPTHGLAVLLRSPRGLAVVLPSSHQEWTYRDQAHFIRWLPDGTLLLTPSNINNSVADVLYDTSWVMDSQGRQLRKLVFGDFVKNLIVTGQGDIWVGYSDVGVFGSDLYDEHCPYGEAGLVRFGPDGSPEFRYNNSLDMTARSGDRVLFIDDCYALCHAEDGIWVYPYGHFRLIHIDREGTIRKVIRTPEFLHGSSSIHVEKDYALFAGPWESRRFSDRTSSGFLERHSRTRLYGWRIAWPFGGISRLPLEVVGSYEPLERGTGYTFLELARAQVAGITIALG